MIAVWLAPLRREEKRAKATRSERFPAIRPAGSILCLLTILVVCAAAQKNPTAVQTQKRRTVSGASMVLDGRGHVLRDTRIVVEGSKIVALDPDAWPVPLRPEILLIPKPAGLPEPSLMAAETSGQ